MKISPMQVVYVLYVLYISTEYIHTQSNLKLSSPLPFFFSSFLPCTVKYSVHVAVPRTQKYFETVLSHFRVIPSPPSLVLILSRLSAQVHYPARMISTS